MIARKTDRQNKNCLDIFKEKLRDKKKQVKGSVKSILGERTRQFFFILIVFFNKKCTEDK